MRKSWWLLLGMAGVAGIVAFSIWSSPPYPTEEGVSLLPSDYASARKTFLSAARSAGANLDAIAIDALGPEGEKLSIDVAWLGSPTPKRVLLHVSGMHGVEGFAGSAIQTAILNNPPPIDNDDALVVVHALNPYGMAWLRRFNENNVDLNRNFMDRDWTWSGSPEGYADVNELINPPTPPGIDFFYLRAMFLATRHGFGKLKAAIASGQYDYPKGLFYGGKQLEQGPSLYRSWLKSKFENVLQMVVIDVHTGLGPWRKCSLFHNLQATEGSNLPDEVREKVVKEKEKSEVSGYLPTGSQAEVFRQLFPEMQIDFFTQEFGTYSSFKVLYALREENRHHHYNGGAVEHQTKNSLKELFSPSNVEWQKSVIRDGIRLTESICRMLSSKL